MIQEIGDTWLTFICMLEKIRDYRYLAGTRGKWRQKRNFSFQCANGIIGEGETRKTKGVVDRCQYAAHQSNFRGLHYVSLVLHSGKWVPGQCNTFYFTFQDSHWTLTPLIAYWMKYKQVLRNISQSGGGVILMIEDDGLQSRLHMLSLSIGFLQTKIIKFEHSLAVN